MEENNIPSSPITTCLVDGCENPGDYTHGGRGGICGMHRSRMDRHGSFDLPTKPTVCSVDGCEKSCRSQDHGSDGKCQMHVRRLAKFGSTELPIKTPKPPTSCAVDGCDQFAKARGLCGMHYQRLINSGEVGGASPMRGQNAMCSVEGCDNPHSSKGLCKPHYQQIWYEDNKEAVIAASTAWQKANPEKAKASWDKWRRNNPERHNLRIARYRSRQRSADGGGFTAAEWEFVKVLYDERCVYCGEDKKPLTIEHLQPLSRGGSNTIENLAPACKPCNSRKCAKTVDEFLAILEADGHLQYCHPSLRARTPFEGMSGVAT